MQDLIRDALADDLPGILAIYNDAVLNTTAIWNEQPVDLANRQAWYASRQAQAYPILVAVDSAGEVLGYSSFGDWRPFEGFATRLSIRSTCALTNVARAWGHV